MSLRICVCVCDGGVADWQLTVTCCSLRTNYLLMQVNVCTVNLNLHNGNSNNNVLMIYNKYQGERKINTLTIQISMRVNGDTVYYRKDIKRKKEIH